MARDSSQDIETAAKIRRSMEAWNAMTDDQRAAALKEANTAIPAEAMRHLGYGIPALTSPIGDSIEDQDQVLAALKRQCNGARGRLGSSTGPVVVVKEVLRDPHNSDLIDAKVQKEDGTEEIVPLGSIFIY